MGDDNIQFSALTASFSLKGGDATTLEVKEKTTCIITVGFLDIDGNTFVPDEITYRLIDKFTNTLRTSGTPTPAASIDIELEPDHNAILHNNNRYEIAVLQIYFRTGTLQSYQVYSYKILNLAHVI